MTKKRTIFHVRFDVRNEDNLKFIRKFQRDLRDNGFHAGDWLMEMAREHLATNGQLLTREWLTQKAVIEYASLKYGMRVSPHDLRYYREIKKLRPKFDFRIEMRGQKEYLYYKRVKIDRFLKRLRVRREEKARRKEVREVFKGGADYTPDQNALSRVEKKTLAGKQVVIKLDRGIER